MAISKKKFYINYQKIGNTVSSTIPIALKDAINEGRLQTGDVIMLVGFGVGYSWGGTIVKWE
jgi:3-oxoacyl-[acyl-carrier-protein] synthase-3